MRCIRKLILLLSLDFCAAKIWGGNKEKKYFLVKLMGKTRNQAQSCNSFISYLREQGIRCCFFQMRMRRCLCSSSSSSNNNSRGLSPSPWMSLRWPPRHPLGCSPRLEFEVGRPGRQAGRRSGGEKVRAHSDNAAA